MKLLSLHRLAALLPILAFTVVTATPSAAHAQLPTNNDVWRARCNMLNALSYKIEHTDAPAILVQSTHGIPSIQFATFAFERSRASEHSVACTMFFMAAIAERAGNGGGGNSKTAHNLLVVAQSEVSLSHNVKPTTYQHLKRGEEEAKQARASNLNSEQSAAVIAASDVIPLNIPH